MHVLRDARLLALAALALSGCSCGEDALTDARPRLEVAPLVLDFGDVVVGDLRILEVQLSNVGGTLLTVTTATISQRTGEYAFASAVDAVGAGQSAALSVVYEPVDLGEDLGQVTLAGNDERPAIVVSVKGRGVERRAAIELEGDGCAGEPGSLSFGRASPGTTVERRITVQSVGGQALEVLSAVVEPGSSGEWAIDGSGLPRTLEGGASLQLVARYTPADGGLDRGGFIITTNSAAMPSIRVPACGEGIAPAICARPVPLALGAVPDGTRRSGRLTIESCGLEPLRLDAVALSMDPQHPSSPRFSLTRTPTTPVTLMPGQSVEAEVTYDAGLPLGPQRAWVVATSNALGATTAYFPVEAHTAAPCGLNVAPGTLYFREVRAGQSATRAALIVNTGESECAVQSVTVTSTGAEFALVMPSAPFTLAAGEVRTVDVRYSPRDAGPHQGQLLVTDNGGTSRPVALVGNPGELPGCAVDVTPTLLSFGITAIGSTPRLGLRVEAIGEDPCRVTAARLVAGNPVFSVTLPALRTAFPGIGGVTIDVGYAPVAAVASSDLVEITYEPLRGGGPGGMVTAGVSGIAGDARICVTPGAVDFGAVSAGNRVTRTVVIESCGAAELNLRGVLVTRGTPFEITQSPALPARLAPGANAAPALTVSYAPTDGGPHFGQLEILSSDPQNPNVRVPLSGNFAGGCAEILQCAPGAVVFGDTFTGTRKLVRVVCRSLGTAPVTVSAVRVSGAGPELAAVAPTPVTIPPGGAWSFDVLYAPGAVSAVTATIDITSNACIAPAAIAVSGRGVQQQLPVCQPPSTFAPRAQWTWNASTYEPTYTNVWSTPLVANLDDDNLDGVIDENDIPDVVFISLDTYSFSDPGASIDGVLRVISGDTGREKFSVRSPRFADTAIPAIGDLDGDGRPEIVGLKWIPTPMGSGMGGIFGRYVTGTLVALDNTGRLLWESDPWEWPPEVSFNAAAPSIADLDGDGFAEIILGRDVFDHRGRLRWRGTADRGMAAAGPHSIVADIDLDGRPEVIAGGTVYHHDGSILWDAAVIRDGGTAVGMIDPLDPFPRIVVHTGTGLVVFDHLGMERWRASIPSMGPATMLPVIADFDGDGDGDIAVADGESVHVFNGAGRISWSAPVSDSTCCAGISAFDFEGDGAYELILTDNGQVYVYRGTDGQRIYRAARTNPTAFEMPVVADVDNDSRGELIVALFGAAGAGGITAYSNVGDTWVAAPRIFNQQAFHVTNVYESGAIPRVMTPLPQAPRVFRGTSAACLEP